MWAATRGALTAVDDALNGVELVLYLLQKLSLVLALAWAWKEGVGGVERLKRCRLIGGRLAEGVLALEPLLLL